MASRGRQGTMKIAKAKGARPRRIVIAIAGLGAVLAAMALIGAAPALAARSYDSSILGFNNPTSAALDAGGNLWFSDSGHSVPKQRNLGQNGIYRYSPYPSQTLLETPNTRTPWAFYSLGLQLAVDQSTEEVFVAQYNGRS